MRPALLAAAALAALAGLAACGETVERVEPFEGTDGAMLYAAACASCHGAALEGSAQGPPFLHRVYEPSHHADAAFFLAVRRGVRAHHWTFGDMPPVPGLTEAQVEAIVAFVRARQREGGIE
jgi:mono/diheme cytochrome c family protein